MEMACKERTDGIEGYLAAVMAELWSVLEGLQALAPDREERGEAAAGNDPVAVRALLQEFHALVANDNIAATDLLQRIGPSCVRVIMQASWTSSPRLSRVMTSIGHWRCCSPWGRYMA